MADLIKSKAKRVGQARDKAVSSPMLSSGRRNSAHRQVCIVFVHGTWGRGVVPRRKRPADPRWFEPGATFREALIAALLRRGIDVLPDSIEWSGANSIRHRDRAAALLAERLDQHHAENPRASRLVIGHSHGGNVCLRAFARLGVPSDGIHVATVATPFVELSEEPGEGSLSALFAWIAFAALSLRLIGWLRGGAPQTLLPFALEAALIGGGIWLALLLFLRQRIAQAARALAEASSQAAYRASYAPTLVLRGFDDEASLTLGFGALATRLSHVSVAAAVNFTKFAVRATTVAAAAGVLRALASIVGDRWLNTIEIRAFPYAVAIAPVVAIAVICLALLEGAAQVVFGRELFLTFLPVRVNSNSVPDAGEHIRVITLAPQEGSRGLRHALYAHPDCAEHVAVWFAEDPERRGPELSKPNTA